MTGLIPDGVYSLFYRTLSPDSANPVCGATVDPFVAMTARFPQRQAPDPSSFVADSSGGAFFHARVNAGFREIAGNALLANHVEALLKKTGAQLWIQHDMIGNRKLKKSPAYYE